MEHQCCTWSGYRGMSCNNNRQTNRGKGNENLFFSGRAGFVRKLNDNQKKHKIPNITANLEVIDQNLSGVVYLSSNSTILLLLPTTRICTTTTGHDLVFVVLPVGVDTLHAGLWRRTSPALHVSEVTGSRAYSLRSMHQSSLMCSAHVSAEICTVYYGPELNLIERNQNRNIFFHFTANHSKLNWNIAERTRCNRGPKDLNTFWPEHDVGCKKRNSKLLDVDQAYELGVKVPRRARSCVYTGIAWQAPWSFKM